MRLTILAVAATWASACATTTDLRSDRDDTPPANAASLPPPIPEARQADAPDDLSLQAIGAAAMRLDTRPCDPEEYAEKRGVARPEDVRPQVEAGLERDFAPWTRPFVYGEGGCPP